MWLSVVNCMLFMNFIGLVVLFRYSVCDVIIVWMMVSISGLFRFCSISVIVDIGLIWLKLMLVIVDRVSGMMVMLMLILLMMIGMIRLGK